MAGGSLEGVRIVDLTSVRVGPLCTQIMADHGMGLVWSPRSNVFLYGAGTDYTKTTDVKMAVGLGIHVARATDWALVGSAI